MTPRQQLYADLAAAGLSQTEIGKQCGVHPHAVCKALARARKDQPSPYVRGNRVRPADAVLAKWREMIANGESTHKALAREFAVSLKTTYVWIPVGCGRGKHVRIKKNKAAECIDLGTAQRSRDRREREAAKRSQLLAQLQEIR